MEWTGEQQILFLLQSVGLGVVQGLFLDVMTSFMRSSRRKRWLWTDILFGPLAAVFTFFGALVVMDGQLHPLLLFGVFFGMVAEHRLVGIWAGWIIRQARDRIQKGARSCCKVMYRIGGACINGVKKIRYRRIKRPKKTEK